jgi:hypothetical protein
MPIMRPDSERSGEVNETSQTIPHPVLVIGPGRAATPDAILVAAVLAGAPTTWLWGFPSAMQSDSHAEANRASCKTQRPRRMPKRRATARRLYAICSELRRLLRKLGDCWRP